MSTSASFTCGGCSNGIPATEGHVIAMDKHWHTGCWKCQNASCGRVLQTDDTFFRVDGKPLCESCYMNAGNQCSNPKCAKPLSGNIVTALNKKYCQGCFKCKCDADLSKESFFQNESSKEPECRKCHEANSQYRCPKCQKGIAGEWTVVKGQRYHTECFSCSLCTHAIGEKEFYTLNEGGAESFACAECYSRDKAPKCAKCNKAVLKTSLIKSVFGEYCADCWRCSSCNTPFAQHSPVYNVNNTPRCENCKSK